MEKYRENYTVRTFECGADKKLRLLTLFNLLQSMATNHAEKLGVGFEALAAKGAFWVFTAYDIRILRLPVWQENLILSTWPSGMTALTALREIQIADAQGTPLVNASCAFAMLDLKRHRPVPVAKNMPAGYAPLPERLVDTTFPHLPEVIVADAEKPQSVRYDDIDVNNHVNNAVYPMWAADALPPEFLGTHALREIRIAFKKSAVLGDRILSKVKFEGNETHHAVVSADDGREFARVVMVWNEKTAE